MNLDRTVPDPAASRDANSIASQVFRGDHGWFVGVADEDGAPFLRESAYFPTRAEAALALGLPGR